jgi:uncharacterized membrane protein
MIKPASRFAHISLALLIAGYATFFSIQLILHYYSFGSRALDLGNMGQSIWNTSQGRFFHQTNQPGAVNRLSLHVEPILIPISLLYHIYSGPEILFIVQSIIVGLGAIPVFALARLKFSTLQTIHAKFDHLAGASSPQVGNSLANELLALIFALVYLLLPALQGATLLDFHAVTLAPTFLLAAFYYLETRRVKRFAAFALLAVACKEDITLLVLMLGLYAFLIKRQYGLGVITAALCLMWVYLAVFVIPPAFAGSENIHWNRYDHLGDTPSQIVLNMVLQPTRFLNHLRAVDALGYLRLLLTPTAFTALLNPGTLLLALPSLGLNLLSNFPPMQQVNSLIYAAPLVPALIISSIYGTANLTQIIAGFINRLTPSPPTHAPRATHHLLPFTPYVLRFTFYVLRFTFYVLRFTPLCLGLLILTASLFYHAQYGLLPGGGQFRGWEEVTDHHRRAGRIFAQIPPQAALSAQDRLNPHVSNRETLYIFDRIDDADHILLDVTLDSWPLHPVALRHRVDQFFADGFGVVDAFDGYLLLAKAPPNLPAVLPDALFDFARVPDPDHFTPQFPAMVTFDDRLQLLGYRLSLGAHEKFLPVIILYWRALQPLAEDYALWPFVIARNGQLIEQPSQRPLVATLWYPTSRWSPAEVIMTSTLPWELAPEVGDEFTLAVGVAKQAWSDPAQRLPITQAEAGLYLFENRTWARLGTFRRSGPKEYQRLIETQTQPQRPYQVQFWNILQLIGADLPTAAFQPGNRLPFTLYWQSLAPVTVDLTSFVHLLDQEGRIVAQLDRIPQDTWGYLPTSAWQPGRLVVDQQTLTLPADLPPGQYRLVAGWYYAPTGQRLPLTNGPELDGNPEGETVQIGVVTVTR